MLPNSLHKVTLSSNFAPRPLTNCGPFSWFRAGRAPPPPRRPFGRSLRVREPGLLGSFSPWQPGRPWQSRLQRGWMRPAPGFARRPSPPFPPVTEFEQDHGHGRNKARTRAKLSSEATTQQNPLLERIFQASWEMHLLFSTAYGLPNRDITRPANSVEYLLLVTSSHLLMILFFLFLF